MQLRLLNLDLTNPVKQNEYWQFNRLALSRFPDVKIPHRV